MLLIFVEFQVKLINSDGRKEVKPLFYYLYF